MTKTSIVGSISVQGAYGIELYIKGGTDYYRLTCLYKPKQSDYDSTRIYSSDFVETQNQLYFTLTPKKGEEGAAHIPSELSYDELFRYGDDGDFTGSEIYIKNNSMLHLYLKNHGQSSYVNTLKPYLYLGKLYPKDDIDNTIMVEINYLKDFALNAIPEHQRTDNLRELFGVTFDEFYSQIYNKMGNTLSLSDPFETPAEYLRYLLETYGTTSIIPEGSTNFVLDRFFINNLPPLLKRKGSYSSLYGIFRFLTNTTNRLNVYEHWHSMLPSAAPFYPISASSIEEYCDLNGYVFQEHLYNDYYTENGEIVKITDGAGERFYTNTVPYPIGSDLILSPHYRVEMDLSTEPLHQYKIIESETAEVIIKKFNELRPVSRFATYSIVLALPSDFTGRYFGTYDGKFSAYSRTKCLRPIYARLTGNYIFSNKSFIDTSINIVHNLNTTNILVQLYTNENSPPIPPYSKFIPKNIIIKNENEIRIELGSPQPFYAFISSIIEDTDEPRSQMDTFPIDVLDSTLPTPIITMWKENKSSELQYEIVPAEHYTDPDVTGTSHIVELTTVDSVTNNYYEISLENTYTTTLSGGSYDYTTIITHSLGTPAVQVEVFEVNPSTGAIYKVSVIDVTIVNKNNISIEVGDISKTYMINIRKLSNSPFIITMGDLIESIVHIKLGNGQSTYSWNPLISPLGVLQSEIPSENNYSLDSLVVYNIGVNGYTTYDIKTTINILESINITEIGLFDVTDKMIFYTTCSPIEVIPEIQKLIFYYKIGGDTL